LEHAVQKLWFPLKSTLARVDAIPQLSSAAVLVLLALLTFVVYWQPLQMHFWGGCDEQACMVAPDYDPIHGFIEQWQNPPGGRPLAFYPLRTFGYFVCPNRVEGFVVLAFFLWLGNALLLKGIVDRMVPSVPALGTTAAVLLIVHRAEPLRYWVMWSALYYLLPLFWFLLALWLLLLSFDRRSYVLLATACVALSAALLAMEGLYPLAVFGPVLMWFKRDDLKPYWKWTAAWCATTAVWAVLFVRYLMVRGETSYQARQAGNFFHQRPEVLWGSFTEKVASITQYLLPLIPEASHVLRWTAIAACVGVLLLFSLRHTSATFSRQRLGIVLGIGAAWAVLGILPFLHLPGLYRTQFLAAPGQAIFLAGVLVLLLSWLPVRVRVAGWTVALILMAASSGVHSHLHQSNILLGRASNFQKTTYIFEQIESISPSFPSGTIVLFEVENSQESPIGYNYHVRRLGEIVLGVQAGQINYEDPIGEISQLTDKGVSFAAGHPEPELVPYENVVIFRLERCGALSLVSELPETISAQARASYRPLERLLPGPFAELRYLRQTPWHESVVCVTRGRDGVMCGHGWERASVQANGQFARKLSHQAEVIINPHNQLAIELQVDVAAETDQSPMTLSLLDENHNLLATRAVQGGATVRYPLQLSSTLPTRFYLRASQPQVQVTRIASTSLGDIERQRDTLIAAPLRRSDHHSR
jgi:hypothetical protein